MLRYVSPLGLMVVVDVSAAGAIGIERGAVGARGRSSRSRQAWSNSKPIADAATEAIRARELRDQGWVIGASREGGRAFPGPARRTWQARCRTTRCDGRTVGRGPLLWRGCSSRLCPTLPAPARLYSPAMLSFTFL